jgi:phosphoglycolate phosphatase-like HAD superfamily hydrolase
MPVIPLRRIIDTLGLLRDAGIELGVATGRPYVEIMIPLGNWNLTHFFNLKRIATYREIKAAEQMLEKSGAPQSLAKPHPYVYLKSLYPELKDTDIVNMPLPIEDADTVLIVGDSAADLMAARTIGCKSAAVMTGVKNLKAVQIMKDLEPDFVLDDMASIKDLF